MNKFIGIGNLCKDIELKYTSNDKTFIQNTIAIKNDFKNINGEYDSEFVNIVVWGKPAEYMAMYARKGMKISIEGRIQTRSYDKSDGTKGYVTEIVCSSIGLLEKITKNSENEAEQTEADPFEDFGNEVEIDDNFLE